MCGLMCFYCDCEGHCGTGKPQKKTRITVLTKWEEDEVSYGYPFNVEIPGLYTCQGPDVWLKTQSGQRGCLVRGCLYQAGRGVSACLCPIACFGCSWLMSGPTPLCFLPSVCDTTHKWTAVTFIWRRSCKLGCRSPEGSAFLCRVENFRQQDNSQSHSFTLRRLICMSVNLEKTEPLSLCQESEILAQCSLFLITFTDWGIQCL